MISTIKGRVVMVTGATDGIGKQTALDLARMGAHVIVHGRNEEKGRLVLDEIRERSESDDVDLLIADLSSMKNVRRLADDVIAGYDRLHVLINNAGVYMREMRLTEDEVETTFAVNYLAPFLLTNLLKDVLVESAPARIINVASGAHWSARPDPGIITGKAPYDGYEAYALSKLAVVLFTYALARRLQGTGVTVNCLHPGVIDTKLLHAGGFGGGSPVEEGSRTSVYLATSTDVEGVSGGYFDNRRTAQSSPISHDEDLQERCWDIGERLSGLS